ncbi:tRNA (N6-threonylcarbamoyladenosine(37)-N6)-methyltransferase TrmO [Roseibacterium beibuensis]|uniref:tRNA (N6-threonylcarbamoyladenosine(37)-N6)-methyltransferase TrmO n=1 Tax=[Roseibacterium] beibuensis TaxID=1193142 RepID=A0ABP9LBS6_9RHOB|nr:tRNA (N6-threonylcarbamoyladenosine(37)-N6)-methyltransferase TrmO [Roseibacterium beibuensis]MCS6623309.1 tRNA (N6-threonylcarbamoyladenosine(37)-N6)-methyltransferase TrmO [Roseibacterium beibuensis]
MGERRGGEVALPFDPADRVEAGVTFIGHIRSNWSKGNAPRNLRAARDTGEAARIELLPDYVEGLTGLEVGRAIQVMYWVDRGERSLIVQSPRHTDGPRGVFAIRSPVRPNPIALGCVVITSMDREAGVIGIDATDAFDGTPVLDIKPWIPTVDVPPGWQPEG